jgi:very-short-patch-repair endonuclease
MDDPRVERARQLRREATEVEKRLWWRLRSSGLGVRFVRQHPVGPYIADFACRSLKLVVELDGSQHGGERDRRRDSFMVTQGYMVLRFWNPEVLSNMDGVLETIRLAILQRRRED